MGQGDEVVEAERKHGVRDASGRPQLVVVAQVGVHERTNGRGVADRRHPADGLPGVYADELRRGATDRRP